MASSSNGCRLHHHNHHCPHCPLRRHCHHCPLHNNNPSHSSSHNFTSPPPLQTQNLPPLAQISQEPERIVFDGVEEDDEPVFVMTDEWREFFAKSEARRKLAELSVENISM
ncbi:hypothetical protein KIW84_046104 [Lathyrus oleraceus]|uniref:Uncharacterized protein n=1 Tax=Pisum sativum TaxID=3888 RepID=A0A9D4XMC3_PEA|nr:hypothetical protein KIW84_046104 [Pisum sativum]